MSRVILVLGWLCGTWLLWRVPSCRSGTSAHRGRCSVVVPARNEEAALPRLLGSLAGQHRAPDEVIVVDDCSTDATASVARMGGATVVAVERLPDGWTGKTWACWTGAQAASGEVLVFLDADTTVAPGGLEALLSELDRCGGLVSVQPYHETSRAYERLSAFFNVVGMMGVDAFGPLRGRVAPSGAFGPCLAARRADYFAVDGHRAVRSEVLEDVALSRRFRAAGLPVTLFGGRDVVAFRMYPAGLGQLVEGWSKNIAQGAGAIRRSTLALVVLWVAGCILAGGRVAGGGGPAAAVYLVYVAQLAWMLRRIGRFGWWPAAAYPVPLGFFLAVFARSLVLTVVRREVVWRGRRIALGRR